MIGADAAYSPFPFQVPHSCAIFFFQYVQYFFYVGTAMAMPYRAHLCDSMYLPMVMSSW